MACDKKSFSSFKEAQAFLNNIKRRHNRQYNGWKGGDKIPKRSYYCDQCKMWHITSKPSDFTRHENKKKQKRW